jgi:hypothetical protein
MVDGVQGPFLSGSRETIQPDETDPGKYLPHITPDASRNDLPMVPSDQFKIFVLTFHLFTGKFAYRLVLFEM